MHEIGHTLGLWHQQMRSDRDDWVKVMYENIYNNYWPQFSIKVNTRNVVPYNYGSVMHYGVRVGLINPLSSSSFYTLFHQPGVL